MLNFTIIVKTLFSEMNAIQKQAVNIALVRNYYVNSFVDFCPGFMRY